MTVLEKQILHRKKICMLGSFGVGKTSLVQRFVYNKFEDKYRSTLGVHVCHKSIFIPATTKIKHQLNLILWDLAHIEKFNEMTKNYFRGANGALVVFDVTRPQNHDQSIVFLNQFLAMNPQARLIFAGNKIDLVPKDNIEMEQLLQFKTTFQAPLLMTSARTGENVEKLFYDLANQLLKTNEFRD